MLGILKLIYYFSFWKCLHAHTIITYTLLYLLYCKYTGLERLWTTWLLIESIPSPYRWWERDLIILINLSKNMQLFRSELGLKLGISSALRGDPLSSECSESPLVPGTDQQCYLARVSWSSTGNTWASLPCFVSKPLYILLPYTEHQADVLRSSNTWACRVAPDPHDCAPIPGGGLISRLLLLSSIIHI